MDRNLLSVILCCREVVPEMQATKLGRIVTIGSIAGCVGRPTGSIYAVAKAAVHEYTRCLAAQLRPDNIAVNCVAPGGTVTERFPANPRSGAGPPHHRKAPSTATAAPTKSPPSWAFSAPKNPPSSAAR